MTDVKSIVDQLRQTRKGRLKYANKDWNSIMKKEPPKLRISPFVVKNNSRLAKATNIFNEDEGNAQDKIDKELKSNIRKTPVEKKTKSQEKLTSPPVSPEFLLADVEKEYDETLQSLSKIRIDTMRAALKNIDDEHQRTLLQIEEKNEAKHNKRRNEIHHQENVQRPPSEELKQFVSIKCEREQKVLERSQQTELQLKLITDKRKQLEDTKQAIKNKKLAMGTLGERIGKILQSVMVSFKENKDLYSFPDPYKQLINQVLAEHANCTNIIKASMGSNGVEHLDKMLYEVTKKMQLIEESAMKCRDIIIQLKEAKEAAEKKRQADEEAAKKKKAEAEEEAKKKAEAATKAQAATIAATAVTTASTATSAAPPVTRTVPVPSIVEAAPNLAKVANLLQQKLSLFSSRDAFDSYLILQKLLSNTQKQHASLSSSKEKDKKTYKFDLYKIVNTQINAISDESPKHLMDKIMKLNTLLTQGEVQMAGKKVTTKGCAEAEHLVKDLVAKKLVLQGQLQVASSFKTAYPIAAVCTGLWALFPDIGDLLLAHFYSVCPYLVPMYFPKSESMTTVEYCQMVGYDVDDGKIEDQDKYLSKLSGCVRLYSAIIQMDMPPTFAGRGHPHGIDHGWLWFTRILNLEPRPSITATIIYDFLEVAGHAMMKRFGKQFQKLLLILIQDMMPKILEVTPQDSKAGATRLKMFLEKCIKEGKMKPPEGVLTERWWSTGRNL